MNARHGKERRVEGVVRMVVGQDHIGDAVGRADQTLERGQDGGGLRHHPGIDDDPDIAILDEADRAGDPLPDVTREKHPKFRSHASARF